MKAYKCDECKEYFPEVQHAVMKLEVGIPGSLEISFSCFSYDLCEECYKKIKEARG